MFTTNGSRQINLAANDHLSRLIQELFPDADTDQFNLFLTLEAQEGGSSPLVP